MATYLKFVIGWLTSFFVTAIITIALRTVILDTNCDPKFQCLCSFDCLITPVVFCTLIFGLSFTAAYWLLARGDIQQANKYQISLIVIVGALSAIFAFGIPLTTIGIIYNGYFSIWLPLSIFISSGTIKLAKKYNKPINQDKSQLVFAPASLILTNCNLPIIGALYF